MSSLTPAQISALVADIPGQVLDLPALLTQVHLGLGPLRVLGGPVSGPELAEVACFLAGGPRFQQALDDGPSALAPPSVRARSPILSPDLFAQLAAKGWLLAGHGRRRRHSPEPANPLWAVPKADGIRHRLITDMRRLNALLSRPPSLGLPMLPALLCGLAATVGAIADPLAVVWDMRGWFFQLAIGGALSAMSVVAGPGPAVIGRMLRLPQGLSWAPLCAQRVHVALIQRAAHSLTDSSQLTGSSWLDNGVVVGPRPLVIQFWSAFSGLCADVGATIKEHMIGVDVPYCGFRFRLRPRSFTWCVASNLAAKLALPLPPSQGLTPLSVFRLAGLALWVAQACLVPLCHFESVIGLMREVGAAVPSVGWHGRLSPPRSWLALLRFWPIVGRLAATWISAPGPLPTAAPWPHAHLYTDAADAGWGVVADIPGFPRQIWSGAWTGAQLEWRIFQREAYALLVAGLWVMSHFPPHHWEVSCDNLGLVFCVGRGHSRVPIVSHWLAKFLPLTPAVATALSLPWVPPLFLAQVAWIPTGVNPADIPSRFPLMHDPRTTRPSLLVDGPSAG